MMGIGSNFMVELAEQEVREKEFENIISKHQIGFVSLCKWIYAE